jgi:hypothetical protein
MYLCHVTQLPEDGARGFDTGGAGQATIFLLRRGDQVRAWRTSARTTAHRCRGGAMPTSMPAGSMWSVPPMAHCSIRSPACARSALAWATGSRRCLRIDDDGGLHVATGEDDQNQQKDKGDTS